MHSIHSIDVESRRDLARVELGLVLRAGGVEERERTPACSTHVVSNKVGLSNTAPAWPADYLTAIMDWVHARLADT